jgi:hypothetical protein
VIEGGGSAWWKAVNGILVLDLADALDHDGGVLARATELCEATDLSVLANRVRRLYPGGTRRTGRAHRAEGGVDTERTRSHLRAGILTIPCDAHRDVVTC